MLVTSNHSPTPSETAQGSFISSLMTMAVEGGEVSSVPVSASAEPSGVVSSMPVSDEPSGAVSSTAVSSLDVSAEPLSTVVSAPLSMMAVSACVSLEASVPPPVERAVSSLQAASASGSASAIRRERRVVMGCHRASGLVRNC
jgi:hypothetical protein